MFWPSMSGLICLYSLAVSGSRRAEGTDWCRGFPPLGYLQNLDATVGSDTTTQHKNMFSHFLNEHRRREKDTNLQEIHHGPIKKELFYVLDKMKCQTIFMCVLKKTILVYSLD